MVGCSESAQFFRAVLPAALPSIFTGMRLGLGFAWVVIVVGEMTGVQTGLGAIIMEARQLSRTEIVISGMIVIGVFGFLSDQLVMLIGRRLLAWSPAHGWDSTSHPGIEERREHLSARRPRDRCAPRRDPT